MPGETELQSVEFFRKVRDQHASLLAGKSPTKIIVFFSEARTGTPGPTVQRTRQKMARR